MKTDAVLCDFDDTLVASYAEFLAAEEEFLAALAALGLAQDKAAVTAWLHAADIANVERCGYLHPSCFPLALGQTYAHFAALAGEKPDPAQQASLEAIGWRVFQRQPRVLPEAADLLSWLSTRARLYLLTQGDLAIQRQRIEGSGLLGYFREAIILRKKTVEAYQDVVQRLAIDPARSWMLGDSLKSDIVPALAVGLQAAHFSIDGWAYELARPEQPYHIVTRLSQFKELISHGA